MGPNCLLQVLIFAWLVGCADGPSFQGAEHVAGDTPEAAVVVKYSRSEMDARGLVWEHPREGEVLDRQVTGCIAASVASARVPVRIVGRETLDPIAFPGLDRRSMPDSADSLALLLEHEEFRARLGRAGIQYLILIGGGTSVSATKGGIGCVGSYGGAGCFGAVWWDNESALSAVVYDVAARSSIGSSTVSATDTSVFGMAFILPFGKPSIAEALSCPKIGAAVAETLARLQRLNGEGRRR